MNRPRDTGAASFEVTAAGSARVRGPLSLATVSVLLDAGAGFLQGAADCSIDLSGVEAADSAGLALLVEWLSLSGAAGSTLRYQNIPAQILQLARLSEVEPLLTAAAAGA